MGKFFMNKRNGRRNGRAMNTSHLLTVHQHFRNSKSKKDTRRVFFIYLVFQIASELQRSAFMIRDYEFILENIACDKMRLLVGLALFGR